VEFKPCSQRNIGKERPERVGISVAVSTLRLRVCWESNLREVYVETAWMIGKLDDRQICKLKASSRFFRSMKRFQGCPGVKW